MSQKRLLTGNFPAKIFEPKFNIFMNIITTILEVRFPCFFLETAVLQVKENWKHIRYIKAVLGMLARGTEARKYGHMR